MKIIKSRNNPIIKKICSLHTKKGRQQARQCIAEGTRTIEALINSSVALVQLYVTEGLSVNLPIPTQKITYVSAEVMEKISSTKSPSGYLGVYTIPTHNLENLTTAVVLADISDPGNMGTLIRSAASMNIKYVLCVQGTDPWSPKVIQASAGSIGMIKIIECSWSELITIKKDTSLCALVVKGGKKPQELRLKNMILVIGNEAHGIPKEWLNDCAEKCTLSMPGNTESLNAAIAGSIALYLMTTQ